MAKKLTARQLEILEFIADTLEDKGVAPTQREIRDHFGYSSYGTVYKHLALLEKKGYLWRDWNQKRGMLLQRPIPGREELGSERQVPFLGRVSPERPIERLSGQESVTVPAYLLEGQPGEHYVLQVDGPGWVEDGIHDGDYLIVERREEIEPGEMVLAMVGSSAILKRYYPEEGASGPRVRLQPNNPRLPEDVLPARRLRIEGAVVSLMRHY